MIRSESLASCRSGACRTFVRRAITIATAFGLVVAFTAAPAFADGGVTFTDIAENGGSGITYQRVPNPERLARKQSIEARGTIPVADWPSVRANETPMKPWGAPGVALIDYDRDGDVDIYVPNGPGAPNSLYSNQLVETGSVTFIDVAAAAGVELTDQESTGICYGDIDNDGDDDIYVTGTGVANRLLESQLADTGTPYYVDITATSGAEGGNRHAGTCSMGDFNGDGLLDIFVGNTYDGWAEHRRPTFIDETCPCLEHNQLFTNLGGNTFRDDSAVSGVENLDSLPGAAFTWVTAAVDIDQDGDVDLMTADTQGPVAGPDSEGRGYNRIYLNDGTGYFDDVTDEIGLDKPGTWMGSAWADFDCNGQIDFFSTNVGDYLVGATGVAPSQWFLQNPDHTWTDPNGGDVVSAFGWGALASDYDNDGDTDIYYHGGFDIMTVILNENPGILLQNQGGCSADFDIDVAAITREHASRLVEGVAAGDLNNDGFDDFVSVAGVRSDTNGPSYLPFVGILRPPFGSPLDPLTRFTGVWPFGGGGVLVFIDPPLLPGDLSVEINSGDNGNGWVEFDYLGGVDLATGASVNRSGIGAVARFTPDGGPTSIRPVLAGANFSSQDEMTRRFGLGTAPSGDLETLWPGGVRNRLYDVQAGENVLIPEIPCSYDGDWGNRGLYTACVMQALNSYKDAGYLTDAERNRLYDSAVRAYNEAH